MHNLIQYCCNKGLEHFLDFKFERKSRVIMREHLVSKKDVFKYNLQPYIIVDKYGRYKLPKYFLRLLNAIIINSSNGYIQNDRCKRTLDEVKYYLINPDENLKEIFDKIMLNFEKDPIRNRSIKIMKIKEKINSHPSDKFKRILDKLISNFENDPIKNRDIKI